MHVEVVLAALVLVVAMLVAVDYFRRNGDGPHEPGEGSAYDARREIFFPASRAGSAPSVSAFEPAGASQAGASQAGASQAGASQAGATQAGVSQPAGGSPHDDTGTAVPGDRDGEPGARPNWLVRTRLYLLVVVSAAAAVLATGAIIRAA